MKNLNRFVLLFCISISFPLFSQIGNGGFKLPVEDIKEINLPQVLLSFEAIINENKVELTWSSDTENNNNFFTIEKSKDAITFEKVTSIKGFGNNSNIISYFDADNTPYIGISYYRLMQTDVKGIILSSRLVSVNNNYLNSAFANSSINSDENAEELLKNEANEILVVLRNEKGLESYSKVNIDPQNNITVPVESDYKLEMGSYIVVASSNNKLYSQKVTVK